MTPKEKTLQMRIQHIFFELHNLVEDLRKDAQASGVTTKKYYLYFATTLEKKLEVLKDGLTKINYIEVQD